MGGGELEVNGAIAGLSKIVRTRYFRILVSAALIVILISRLDLGRTAEAFRNLSLGFLLLALLTFAASLVLGNFQWTLLLRLQGIRLSFRKSLSFYFVGAFFNNFLPANIGGDVVRIYDVYQESQRANASIAATVTDRLFGMIALALLAVPAGIVVASRAEKLGLQRDFGRMSLLIVLAFIGILGLAAAVIFSRRLARFIDRILGPLLFGGLRERFKRVYESFQVYASKSRNLGAVLVVAMGVQVLRVIVHYEISKAMGLSIQAMYFFLFIPVIAIFIALPISIGGLGVREGLEIFFFCRAVNGLGREQAFTMGLLAYIVGIVVSLVGGVIYFSRNSRPQSIEQIDSGGNMNGKR